MTETETEPLDVRAASFPPRYKIHKYWGKKPGNVIAAHIERFAPPGAPVLDPFAGSGVVLAESLIAGRRGISVDLNPIAGLITRVTVEGASPAAVRAAGEAVLAGLAPLRRDLFGLACPSCKTDGEVIWTSFRGSEPVEVVVDCVTCGPTRGAHAWRLLPDAGAFPDGEIYRGWQMRKLERAGITLWRELFTERNMIAIAHIRRAIDLSVVTDDPLVRRALLVSFTAHLAQASRMISDAGDRGGGPSWKLNSFWLPKNSRELNPFRYFANRVRATVAGLWDMQAHIGRRVVDGVDYDIWTQSADTLGDRLDRGSIGYIFTDPPYGGEGIQYGELSMLWNLWSGDAMALEREVVFNPRRNKDAADYERGLGDCLAPSFDALTAGGHMSVTFANKEPRFVDALTRACARVGFSLVSEATMAPSAPNITQMLCPEAPKFDQILNFRKPTAPKQSIQAYSRSDF